MEPISGYDTMLLIIAVLLMGLWFLIQEFKNAECEEKAIKYLEGLNER